MLARLFAKAGATDDLALFDCDEARLAVGTGSALLDAYLSRSNVNPYAAGPDTPLGAIKRASEQVRGDIFARVCAMSLTPDNGPNDLGTRLDRVLPYLRGLVTTLRDMPMSLPSAAAARLIRRDKTIAARGWFPAPPQGISKTFGDEARTLAMAALRADEPRRDPGFDALLGAFLDSFETHCAALDSKELTQALAFAQTCLTALGRDPDTFSPARAKDLGLRAADQLLETWRKELPPPLWRFFAILGHFEEGSGHDWGALIEQMAAGTPETRGAIAERLWRMMEEAQSQPEGVPFRFETLLALRGTFSKPNWARVDNWPFDKLWHALLAKRCVLTPEFALKLVRQCTVMQWSDTTNFARSLAEALPRTQEAREAVERRFAEQPCYRAPAELRALDNQKLILLDALADARAVPSLESRAADARAAFEQAMLAEREKVAKAGAAPETPLGSLERIRARGERRFDTHKLCPLFVAAVKLGPVPETWLGLLQEVADDVEVERQELVQLAARPSDDFVFRAKVAMNARDALDAAAAIYGLYTRVTAAEREALLAAEDFAARAPAGAAPSAKWAKAAQALAQAPEAGAVRRVLLGSMARAGFLNMGWVGDMFGALPARRALVWLLAFHPVEKVAKPLGELAARGFTPSPQGPENETIGNACIWALAELADGAGLSTLARLGARVRYPKTRQRIQALFEATARKTGRTRAEVEEEIASSHGFDAEGVSRFALAGEMGAAEIRLNGHGKAQIVWRDQAGKTLKAPTAAMKEADVDGVKAVREAVREIEADLGVLSKRIERLYRSRRTLDFARWREFYVAHPFVGPIARRLIWRAEWDGGSVAGLWRDGAFEDVEGKRRDVEAAHFTLWHPIDAREAEIAAWRDRLGALGIDQPFRQAWRETYRVTDAERRTGHYSNRFAAHIVRQHQFMTLARLEDWNCRHRMFQDVPNDEPTYIAFPDHGVYAEYWTAGAGGDDPPVADSTAYLYLTTDRVVFHRLNPDAPPNRPTEMRGEPLTVDEIPAIAFSEILRACDLFVSVASIARDARWLDRGGAAEHPNGWRFEADAYWRGASDSALQANAAIRRELLARLLPALNFGERLRLDDRRLHVKGVRGAYAIHLGSGAVFHESGRHICIVPDGAPKKLVLPYEGDETLALIMSKAMLLLRDDEIVDPVITCQL